MVSRIRQRLEIALDLVTPSGEIGLDHARLLIVRNLRRPKRLDTATPAKLASARGAKVPNPLGITARCDEIALAIVRDGLGAPEKLRARLREEKSRKQALTEELERLRDQSAKPNPFGVTDLLRDGLHELRIRSRVRYCCG
jgi:hypothetical protein